MVIDIIPFRTSRLTTKLTKQEITKRIDLLFDKHTDLIGYTESDTFVMERKIQYQNPFKPIVREQVSESGAGTQVTINYRPKTFVMIFYSSIILVFVVGAVKLSTATGLGGNPSGQFIVSALILFLLLMIGFNVERNKIEKRINGQIE